VQGKETAKASRDLYESRTCEWQIGTVVKWAAIEPYSAGSDDTIGRR